MYVKEQWLLDQYDLTSPLHEDTSSRRLIICPRLYCHILVYSAFSQPCEQGYHSKWHVPGPDLELWEALGTNAAWQGRGSTAQQHGMASGSFSD